ncbi:C-type lectin domain family 4 member M-like [Parambassis ranga]|uniref:C-type lectin domain family 4 member M-like n=1 Tax=Parambassis ranga TaxID=210632 RepID=A0A6P7J5Y6_9TELE|nr:C-type lectin domain family 4 member M-like [Parambassis ranga]
MRMERRNIPVASTRLRKIYRPVIVSFGLLFLLQVVIIVLRLTIIFCPETDPEATVGNLTEEMLKRKMELVPDSFDSPTPGFEATIKTPTDERETLTSIDKYYSKKGWVFFQNSIYYISSTKKSWQASREDCLLKGGDLVIVDNKEEQDFIRQFEMVTWIGLTDTKTEGIWKWVDGTLLNTSYWKISSGITDDGNGENEKKNSWDGEGCGNNNFWICEKTMAV